MKRRSDKEIKAMTEEFYDKIWLDRHLLLREKVENGISQANPEIWERALKAEERIYEKYGEENLGPYDDFDWGMLNGKLSALRWVMGYDWDFLDT